MYVDRTLERRLKQLFQRFPVVVVSGARQVGKSTLVQHAFPDLPMVVFDPVLDVENARSDPDLFLRNRRPPVVLDEVQYAPELLAAVKRLIDRDRKPGMFVMTGSQQWGVVRSISESLAGRAVFLDLEGFSLAEVVRIKSPRPWLLRWLENPQAVIDDPPARLQLGHSDFELLWRGWLPEAQLQQVEFVPELLQGYLRTYIERDVRTVADVSDLQLFGRFVRLASALTGQEINHSQLGRELGLTPQTAKRWLDVLVSTFQWFEIPPYLGNLIKRVSQRPKGYFADTGMACYLQAISTPEALGGHPLWGALFETAVAAELRKQIALLSPPPRAYHWRSAGGAEVDFVLERDGVLFPIEAKGKSNTSRRDASGLKAFRKSYPRAEIAPGLILAPCDAFYSVGEQEHVLPWDSR